MKKVLLVLVLAGLVYCGYTFSKPYLTSYFLKGEMQQLADKANLKTDREILKELVAFSQERGLPLTQRDFKITRKDGRTHISVNYSQTVEIPWLSKRYDFELNVVS